MYFQAKISRVTLLQLFQCETLLFLHCKLNIPEFWIVGQKKKIEYMKLSPWTIGY